MCSPTDCTGSGVLVARWLAIDMASEYAVIATIVFITDRAGRCARVTCHVIVEADVQSAWGQRSTRAAAESPGALPRERPLCRERCVVLRRRGEIPCCALNQHFPLGQLDRMDDSPNGVPVPLFGL